MDIRPSRLLSTRTGRTVAGGATLALVAGVIAIGSADAHVGVNWDSPQPPQLGKTSVLHLTVPHGCSFTAASLTTPASGQTLTTVEQLGLAPGSVPIEVPGHVELTNGTYFASTTSMQIAIPRVATAGTPEWLGVNAGGVNAQFMPGSGWTSGVDESSADTTVASFHVDTAAPIASQSSALPYHEYLQFGLRLKVETRKTGATYNQPTVSQPVAYGNAASKLVLVTKQGCEMDFSNDGGTTVVRKTVYAGDLVNGWGSSSPTLTVGLDPAADLTRGPAGPAGSTGATGATGPAGAAGSGGSGWAGQFAATRTGTGSASRLVVLVDASRSYVGKPYVVRTTSGRVIVSGRLNSAADARIKLWATIANKVVKGQTLVLFVGGTKVATDKA